MNHAELPDDVWARIALVEDDPILALLLRYNLETSGVSVDCYENGAVALANIFERPPSAVVLDWELPGLSGIEVLRKLRHDDRTACLPVMMLTGRSEREDRARAAALGVDAYIVKPFIVREVMTQLVRLAKHVCPRRLGGMTESSRVARKCCQVAARVDPSVAIKSAAI